MYTLTPRTVTMARAKCHACKSSPQSTHTLNDDGQHAPNGSTEQRLQNSTVHRNTVVHQHYCCSVIILWLTTFAFNLFYCSRVDLYVLSWLNSKLPIFKPRHAMLHLHVSSTRPRSD
jgi:hypothetical protein